jgi:hypothetical protein
LLRTYKSKASPLFLLSFSILSTSHSNFNSPTQNIKVFTYYFRLLHPFFYHILVVTMAKEEGVSFSPREMEVLALAWQCMETEPKVSPS